MKEHLEYMTAEDTDNLILELGDLIDRIDLLREEYLDNTANDSYKQAQKRSLERLTQKRERLLLALKQSLEGLE